MIGQTTEDSCFRCHIGDALQKGMGIFGDLALELLESVPCYGLIRLSFLGTVAVSGNEATRRFSIANAPIVAPIRHVVLSFLVDTFEQGPIAQFFFSKSDVFTGDFVLFVFVILVVVKIVVVVVVIIIIIFTQIAKIHVIVGNVLVSERLKGHLVLIFVVLFRECLFLDTGLFMVHQCRLTSHLNAFQEEGPIEVAVAVAVGILIGSYIVVQIRGVVHEFCRHGLTFELHGSGKVPTSIEIFAVVARGAGRFILVLAVVILCCHNGGRLQTKPLDFNDLRKASLAQKKPLMNFRNVELRELGCPVWDIGIGKVLIVLLFGHFTGGCEGIFVFKRLLLLL
mmetsp:Transcript_22666/g.36694  ORF Transcript_22666/g.36694 Transcript_22666/m.36694 type:complete len:339 (-) Transcript_22666:1176-2192(-)